MNAQYKAHVVEQYRRNWEAFKTTKQRQTKQVAFNPTTRRYEEVNAEDETVGSNVITLYWSDGKWVTIPE